MKNLYSKQQKQEVYISQKKFRNWIVLVGFIFFLLGRISVGVQTVDNLSAASTATMVESSFANSKPCNETFYISQSQTLMSKNNDLKNRVLSLEETIFDLNKEIETQKKNNSVLMSLKNLKEDSPRINRELSFNVDEHILKEIDNTSRKNYIKNYYRLALAEQQKYGIPASVTLAQGILESRSGTSSLAKSTNNHFGMKYHGVRYVNRIPKGSKLVDKSKFKNYADDDPDDVFLGFPGVWHSYRYHSELLVHEKSPYIKHIPTDRQPNYKDWCLALKRGGYATDPSYAKTLIKLINDYNLHLLDNIK